MISLHPNEYPFVRKSIENMCGIRVGDNKSYLIESRLGSLAKENRCDNFSALCRRAKLDASGTLRDSLVDAMTTHETHWLRDAYPFQFLKDVLLPKYSKEFRKNAGRKVRIWCAACSTGQEPYSIAMTILEAGTQDSQITPTRFEILATDISESALQHAKKGCYDSFAMSRGLPVNMRNLHFKVSGAHACLTPQVKSMVRFQQLNLQSNFGGLGVFDIIFCRNVMIYFSDAFKRTLLDRFYRALTPAGILFLGASESMSGFSTAYEIQRLPRGIYYQRGR